MLQSNFRFSLEKLPIEKFFGNFQDDFFIFSRKITQEKIISQISNAILSLTLEKSPKTNYAYFATMRYDFCIPSLTIDKAAQQCTKRRNERMKKD